MKPSNPKSTIAIDKVPLELVPASFKIATAMGLHEGRCKYAAWNWRTSDASLMTYLGALDRHMAALVAGENIDEDSGLPHLWKMASALAVIIDADACGMLVDDRPPAFNEASALLEVMKARCREMRLRYAAKTDAQPSEQQ